MTLARLPNALATLDREGPAGALMDALDAARAVQRHPQFFMWLQTHLRRFLPHDLALYAAPRPGRHALCAHVFHGVPLPQPLLATLSDAQSPLLRRMADALSRDPAHSVLLALDAPGLADEPAASALRLSGFQQLLVHGVASAREPQALDSLFAFGARERRLGPADAQALDLLIAPLHLVALRVARQEVPRGETPGASSAAGEAGSAARQRAADPGRAATTAMQPLTAREQQILSLVREGLRNSDIGVSLQISALTVKNHLQKILRKLGASNRAQAVAVALSHNLLVNPPRAVTSRQATRGAHEGRAP